MKNIKTTKAYLAFMLILGGFICSLPAPAFAALGSLGAAASFGVFGGGAGMTNQGIYTQVAVPWWEP